MMPEEREQEIKKLEEIIVALNPLCRWEIEVNRILFIRYSRNSFIKRLRDLNREKIEKCLVSSDQ